MKMKQWWVIQVWGEILPRQFASQAEADKFFNEHKANVETYCYEKFVAEFGNYKVISQAQIYPVLP